MAALNKYGRPFDGDSGALFHGVNRQMVLCPSSTGSFWGPLSTTDSLHVARTFATAHGMVLKLESAFPDHPALCRAFNASLISDFPEEKEWLIGSMYVRILNVETLGARLDIKELTASQTMKHELFALQLFKQQIFAMDHQTACVLRLYLTVSLTQNCGSTQSDHDVMQQDVALNVSDSLETAPKCKVENVVENELELQLENATNGIHSEHYWKDRLDSIRRFGANRKNHKMSKIDNFGDSVTGEVAEQRVCQRLWAMHWLKFEEFRKCPNQRQRVRFDVICDELKPFFMDNDGDGVWALSFERILRVYPNLKEAHFVNEYKVNDNVLSQLAELQTSTLEKVVFLCFRSGPGSNTGNQGLSESSSVMAADLEKESLRNLEESGWTLKMGSVSGNGLKITLQRNRK